MMYENWDEIIVQWVNCLDITSPIEDIENCKEDFFSKFVRILNHKTINDDVNIIEVIYSLLESIYVDFKFNKKCPYVTELSRDETIELCLLLMYYACVIDQKEALITPLCNGLPHKTQLCVKHFLETMTIGVTAITLPDIANNCMKTTREMASSKWRMIGDSPLNTKNPLRDYLRTPFAKKKVLEKDKEIRNLRNELESERFDKADLYEEIKEHKDKINKLEGKLKERHKTVLQLEAELYNRENKDAIDGDVTNIMKTAEKHFKSEIDNLEQYCRQMEREQIKLQEKNEKLMEKLKVSNDQLKVWQEKTFGLETEQEDLLQKYKQQQDELENLKLLCNELTNCLDTLRSGPYEAETSISSPLKTKRRSLNYSLPESLAESIVEVQLRDCRNENAQLKDLLQESSEKSKLLENELTAVTSNYQLAADNCMEIENKNKELLAKIEEFTKLHISIQDLLKESEKEITELSKSISEKDSMVICLKQSLTQANEINDQLQTTNEELKLELHKIETDFKANQQVLLEKDNLYESLKCEAKNLQQKYEQSLQDHNNLSMELNNLHEHYNSAMQQFSTSLEKLARLSEDYKNDIYEDKFEMFEDLLEVLEKEKLKDKDVIEKLTISLNNSEGLCKNLNAANLILSDRVVLNGKERDKFEKMLQASELHVKELEKSLEWKNEEINSISLKIFELHNTINELQSLKPRDTNRIQENILSNNFGKVIDNIINDIKKNKQDYSDNLSMKEKEIDGLNNELRLLMEMNESSAREFIEKEKTYLEKMFVLESAVNEYTTTIEHFESTIEASEQNLKIKEVEIEELQKGRVAMQDNFDKVKNDLDKKIELTSNTQKKLEIEIQVLSDEKAILENDLKNFNDGLKRLELEKFALVEQNNLLKQQYSECIETLNIRDQELEDRDNIISESNKQFLTLKLELELCKQKHKELQVDMDKVRHEESKHKFCVTTLEEKNKVFESKLKQLTYERDVLKDVKENLERKCSDLEHNLENIIKQLKEKNEDLNDYCNQLAVCKRENETEVQNLKMVLEETQNKLEELIVEKNDAVRRYEEDISALKADLQEATNRMYELNSKEISYIQEIQIIKSELANSFQKYTDTLNVYQELKLEHETQVKHLTETLHDVAVKCNQLEQDNKDLNEQLENVVKEQELVRLEKTTLEVKLVSQQKKYDQELENTREQFLLDINNLKQKEKKLEHSLTKAVSDLENGRGIHYRLENEVKKLTMKLHDIQQEKDYLQERFQLLEDTKKEVDLEYSQLKLAHKKYISESEHNLQVHENKLEVDVKNLQSENKKLATEYLELQKTMEYIMENGKITLKEHEQIIQNLNTELKSMTEKISNLENLNVTISKEQENLLKNTRKLTLEVYERTEEIEKQNAIISKLQCAYDILQTGKDRVEVDLKNIIQVKQKLEQDKIKYEELLHVKLKTYQDQVQNLNEQLDKKNKIITEKDKVLTEKVHELSELHQVYKTMTCEKETLLEQYQQSHLLHKEFLSQIDEENLKAIGDMTFDFMEMKVVYQNVLHTFKKLKKEKKKLEKSLEEINLSKKDLQAQYEEKQHILDEIQKKCLNYENIIVEERTNMHDMICELHCAISDLEWVKNEKCETEKQEKSINIELKKLKKSRDELLKIKSTFYKSREEQIAKNHLNAEALKNELLKMTGNIRSDFISAKSLRNQLEEIIQKEKDAKTFLEVKLLNLMNEKMKYEQICGSLCKNINKISNSLLQKPIANSFDFGNLSEEEMKSLTEEIERNIVDVYAKIHEINESVLRLEQERTSIESKLNFLENEKSNLLAEKHKLLNDYEMLNKEKSAMQVNAEHEKHLLQEEVDGLKVNLDSLDKFSKEIESLKNENDILHQTVQSLKQNNVRAYNDYQKFMEISKTNKNQLDKLLKDRNSTETVINDLKQKLLSLQMKFIHLPQEFLYKRYFDQKESLQIIVDDIQKQFNRFSRISFNIMCNFGSLSEKIIQAIFADKTVEVEAIFKDLDIEETHVKVDELKDRALDGLEQIAALEKVLENLEIKSTKVLKENVKMNQAGDSKADEEYRKKYFSIKQKLTLAENVKNNYEKKLKQLREENRKLSVISKSTNEDAHYKTLLEQHIESKDSYERQIMELKANEGQLQNELVTIKNEKSKMEETYQNNIKENYEKQLGNLREKQSSLEKEIIGLHTQKTALCESLQAESKREIELLRDAYGKLMGDKSKLDSDYNNLKKTYEERTNQLQEYALIKEAYEKLLEENNQMMTEVDTLKFKRTKDKEEYIRLIRKEREEFTVKEEASLTKVRIEYESKLETMKKKMLQMYKEEVDKEMRKVLVEKSDNAVLLHSLERYKTELEDARKQISQLKNLNFAVGTRRHELMLSQESLGSRSVKSECDMRELWTREVIDCPRSGKRSSVHPARTVVESRKCMTLPKNMDVIEEDSGNRIVNPANIAGKIEMEDEGECFHNKYLADLKDGRCVVQSGRESTSSRISELAWRNSMVPPHLKSSYPAELQMITPSRFKEEDIKAGTVELDDSMSSKLLPQDKGTRKKEQGTTSYKKPGPPTPSKNGGRVSLQGSEVKDTLRDSNDSKTPKRSTPNKIKAFFLGRTSIGRGALSSTNTENQPPTSPKSKQMNKLFRKAR